MKLILIEGVPGSGKTTLAEGLCNEMIAAGLPARWYREEAHDHPVHPLPLKAHKYDTDFAARCTEAWRRFLADEAAYKGAVILEGSALQSAVRFMLEADREAEAAIWFRTFVDLVAPVLEQFIWLKPVDLSQHLHWTENHRGEAWAGKVAAYLARCPWCVNRSVSSGEAMQRFWPAYARLCEQLLTTARLPVQFVECGHSRVR